MGFMQRLCLQALRNSFKGNFLPQKGVIHRDVVNTYGVLRMKENELNALKENGRQLHDEILHEHQIKSSVKMHLIEPENNNAFSKSEIETQMQRQEENVNMREAVDAGLVCPQNAVDKARQAGYKKQEKVFANAALKNELRKIKGNSVDTKFAKASILGKPPLQPSRNHLVVRQPNAFTSERPRISRPRFASQVDEKNDLSKTVTPHYLPKVRESAAAKPHQVNAPNYSRNSHKESYGSNDMVHAYFLEDARKMTQDKTRIPSHKDMASTRAHCTPNACTPKPRNIYRSSPVSKCSGGMSNGEPLVDHSRNSSFFLDSKQFVCSICHKYIFNTNHDDCITKILNKVNSRAKVQSPKIRNNNPVEPKNHTHKPGRQNGIGQRFSLNKSSAVHEKPHTPRSYLRWKPTGRIFKTVSLRWIPTGKVFIDSTTKVDSEPPNGSNDDITNPYECNQTLYVSAGTSNSSAGTSVNPLKERLGRSLLHDNIVPKPDLALELGKSISLTEAEEEAVAREVHAAHARIVYGPDIEHMQARTRLDQTLENYICPHLLSRHLWSLRSTNQHGSYNNTKYLLKITPFHRLQLRVARFGKICLKSRRLITIVDVLASSIPVPTLFNQEYSALPGPESIRFKNLKRVQRRLSYSKGHIAMERKYRSRIKTPRGKHDMIDDEDDDDVEGLQLDQTRVESTKKRRSRFCRTRDGIPMKDEGDNDQIMEGHDNAQITKVSHHYVV
ncbi:hypothetical protein Tco_1133960 [Tanacetum coccineum]